MDASELRMALLELRAASNESAVALSAQLDILEAAVHEMLLGEPTRTIPADETITSLNPDDAFYVQFEL